MPGLCKSIQEATVHISGTIESSRGKILKISTFDKVSTMKLPSCRQYKLIVLKISVEARERHAANLARRGLSRYPAAWEILTVVSV